MEAEAEADQEIGTGRSTSQRSTSQGSLFGTLLAFSYLLSVVLAAFWSPGLGLALASLGIGYLVFRIVSLDATAVLTLYLLTLLLVPASYVVPSVGAAGTPANGLSLGCAYWWVLQQTVSKPSDPAIPQVPVVSPVRVGLLVFLGTTAVSFVAAFARPLDSIETNGSARSMIVAIGLTGVALLAADGIPTLKRVQVLLNRLLNLAALMSVVAFFQFFTDFDPVTQWRLPGLELNKDLLAVAERSVVNRVASTTLHPIEFGAVLAVLLPLALHTAFYAPAEVRFRRWLRVGVLGLALPMSVSRTAVLILVVALLLIWPAWTWRRRLYFLGGAVVFLMAVRAVISGLLGTIVALFTNLGEDPSTAGRTEDYADVWVFFGERPIFGRGLGTFDPILYFYLDNQVLMTVITGGIVALTGLVLLIVISITTSRLVYWHGSDEESRHLGATLAGSIAGGFVGFFTFDALGFPIFAGVLFLLLGMAGAAWRLDVQPFGRRYTNPRHASAKSRHPTLWPS